MLPGKKFVFFVQFDTAWTSANNPINFFGQSELKRAAFNDVFITFERLFLQKLDRQAMSTPKSFQFINSLFS